MKASRRSSSDKQARRREQLIYLSEKDKQPPLLPGQLHLFPLLPQAAPSLNSLSVRSEPCSGKRFASADFLWDSIKDGGQLDKSLL